MEETIIIKCEVYHIKSNSVYSFSHQDLDDIMDEFQSLDDPTIMGCQFERQVEILNNNEDENQ